MDGIGLKPGVLAGYRWYVFKFPMAMPHQIDVLLTPNKQLAGWVRTSLKTGLAEALVTAEGLHKTDNVNLLNDGIWLGLYPKRITAADTVVQYVKHVNT